MGNLKLRTIGIHPLTDALQLHAILDALHTYGLDPKVTVEPKEGYHEIIVPEEIRERAGYALTAYTLRLIFKETLLGLGQSQQKGKRKGRGVGRDHLRVVAEILTEAENLASNGTSSNAALRKGINELSEAILKHFGTHPIPLDAGRLGMREKRLEPDHTSSALRAVLGGELIRVIGEAKRVIPALPAVGKFYYVDATVRSWGAHAFDSVCGRFVRAGLGLAMAYPVRLGEKSYGVGLALTIPATEVKGCEVWRAQAALRTLRHRWVRGRSSWGYAHVALMLIDAFRLTKSFSEGAAGYVVEALLTHSQGRWKNYRDAEHVKMLHITGAESMGYAWYSKGVNVAGESVMPSYPALRLASRLELLGGSVDWLVDDLIMRHYRERREGEWVLNYAFTSRVVKAVTEYDVESLYLALREAAAGSGGVVVGDPYQLERLVAALESLASEG